MWACPFPSAVSVKSLCHLEVAGSSRSSAGTQSLGCQDDVATLWHCMQILQLQIWQALTIYGRSLSNMTSLTTSVVFFQVSRKTGVLFGREQRPVLWTVVRWLSHAAQRSQAKKPDPEKLLLSVGKLHKLHILRINSLNSLHDKRDKFQLFIKFMFNFQKHGPIQCGVCHLQAQLHLQIQTHDLPEIYEIGHKASHGIKKSMKHSQSLVCQHSDHSNERQSMHV